MPKYILKDRDKKKIVELSLEEELTTREIAHHFSSIGRPEVNQELVRKFLTDNGYGRRKMEAEKKELELVAQSIELDIQDDSLASLMNSIVKRKLEIQDLKYPESPAERLDFFITEAEKLAHRNRNDAYFYGMSIAVYEKLLNLRSKYDVPVESSDLEISIKFDI